MRKVLTVVLCSIFVVPNLLAWGQDGHRIVCRIAYDLLSADDRHEVDRLTKAYHTPPHTDLQIHSYPDACIFPDEARSKAVAAEKAHNETSPWLRFKEFNNWHFLNVSRDTHKIAEDACKNDCVLTGIEKHAQLLKDATDDRERAEALIFLGHWTGDVHQPLHVSYADDQGGNLVQPVTSDYFPTPKKYPLNLHSVWDSGMILKVIAEPGWRHFADHLRSKITAEEKAKWLASTDLDWAQESYDITTEPGVEYCKQTETACESFGNGRELTKQYEQKFIGDVDRRLEQAGVRLAEQIHKALHP